MLKYYGQFRTAKLLLAQKIRQIKEIKPSQYPHLISLLSIQMIHTTKVLINFCLNGWDKEFIRITKYGSIWTKNQQKYRFSFNKKSFKLAIS